MASEVHVDERRDVAPEAASSNLVARPTDVASPQPLVDAGSRYGTPSAFKHRHPILGLLTGYRRPPVPLLTSDDAFLDQQLHQRL